MASQAYTYSSQLTVEKNSGCWKIHKFMKQALAVTECVSSVMINVISKELVEAALHSLTFKQGRSFLSFHLKYSLTFMKSTKLLNNKVLVIKSMNLSVCGLSTVKLIDGGDLQIST